MNAKPKQTKTRGTLARVTLTVLAREAGVSPTAVSLALNGKGEQYGLSAATIERIQETARRLNYIPNESARSLRRGNTGLVAALFPHLRNDWADRIVAGIEEGLEGADLSLVILNHRENAERERCEMALLMQRRVEGVICNPQEENLALYREVIRRGMPLVFFSDALKALPEVSCSAWDPHDLFPALEHLARTGRRHIGLLGVRDGRLVASARIQAFGEGLARHGLLRSPDWMVLMEKGGDVVSALQERLQTGRKLPDALLALYDDLAFRAADVLADAGVRVPEDVALLTLGDSPMAGPRGYNLTTVAAPVEEEGRAAGKLMAERLRNPQAPARLAWVGGGRLIVRGSTA